MHFRHFLIVEAYLEHHLSGEAAIFLGIKSFVGSFEENLTRSVKLKRLSFITQFKIEFLLPFTGWREVVRKMPGQLFSFKSHTKVKKKGI